MMKIVIAPDSFKGVLSSLEAANCIENGIRRVLKECEILKLPMADGGEGTVQALVDATGGEIIYLTVKDPLGREIKAKYGFTGDRKTAVIEMAEASGLPLLKQKERNPLKTTTFGTGQFIHDALRKGAQRVIIGIGGSATVDGGTGMAIALGAKFFDDGGRELEGVGGKLSKIRNIDVSAMDKRIGETEFLVACDVTNPLLGEKGAARVYGPQKGATPEMVESLEIGLGNLSELIKKDLGKDVSTHAGAGAAGGLGAGLMAFLNASLKPGIDIVIEAVKLPDKIRGADLVITGEGRIDEQTAFGKTPAGVAKVASSQSIPVVAIGGQTSGVTPDIHSCGITAYFSALRKPMSDEEIQDEASEMLTECSEQIARLIKTFVCYPPGVATV